MSEPKVGYKTLGDIAVIILFTKSTMVLAPSFIALDETKKLHWASRMDRVHRHSILNR